MGQASLPSPTVTTRLPLFCGEGVAVGGPGEGMGEGKVLVLGGERDGG